MTPTSQNGGVYSEWFQLDASLSDKYGCVCPFEFAGRFCGETMYEEVNAPTKWAVGLYTITLGMFLPHGGNSLRWSELTVWDTNEYAINNGRDGDPSAQWCENRCSEAPGYHNTSTLLSGESPGALALSAALVHPRPACSSSSSDVQCHAFVMDGFANGLNTYRLVPKCSNMIEYGVAMGGDLLWVSLVILRVCADFVRVPKSWEGVLTRCTEP
eukprot:COSAG05_NODE_3855_length_1805_cov_1.790152_1_plen_213_part_10